MKKCFISCMLQLLFLGLFAQDNTAVLTVLGQSRLEVIPDVTNISIALSSIDPQYEKAIGNLKEKTLNLKSFLKDQNIDDDYIDSENFQVNKEFNYQDGKQEHTGYNAQLRIMLKFKNDNNLANKIINSIHSSGTDAEVSINYELSLAKQDSINHLLIQSAIKDATKKAKLIAGSTNQELAKIHKINYGVRENVTIDHSINQQVAHETMDAGARKSSFTIRPNEVVRSTHIIIYWALKEKNVY